MAEEQKSLTPIVVVPPPPAPERWKPQTSPEVDELLKKIPVFSYQTGNLFYLSKREHLIIETWILTQNIHECTRVVNAVMPPRRRISANGKVSKSMGVSTVFRWLKKPKIAEHITERQKDIAMKVGYTEAKWIAEGIQYKNGTMPQANKLTHFYWMQLGKALGYYKGNDVPQFQLNQMIQFTQTDGRI